MSLLCDRVWPARLSSHDGPLLDRLYLPALSCAVRYDRSSGFFSPRGLALATRGLERLVANRGRMRLIVDCHLDEAAVAAIRRGESLRDSVAASLLRMPLVAEDPSQAEALELMAWLIARGHLDVKVAVPCTPDRQPLSGSELFHEKAGIIEDGAGNRLAFTGSANESGLGWAGHWESFDIHTSWAGSLPHLEEAEASFQRLWVDRAKGVIVLDVPAAVRAELLRFLPPEGDPKRLRALTDPVAPAPEPPEPATPAAPPEDPRALVWAYIRAAPTLADGGARVGEATSAVTPWPHQIRAFHRLYDAWPPRLLIADEVGLGKTIQAGMLLRQAWLSGRAKRILILAPKAVLGQWQVELREKFNLNWPIYDGQKLTWYPSPALFGAVERPVDRDAWHREPVVLASSHLMRRRDRAQALVSEAEPWDLVILDEAHHARRRGGGLGSDARPNHLLRLMRQLKSRTDGLVLLTATPMQVSPVEVWDLLDLLGVDQAPLGQDLTELPPLLSCHPRAAVPVVKRVPKAVRTAGSRSMDAPYPDGNLPERRPFPAPIRPGDAARPSPPRRSPPCPPDPPVRPAPRSPAADHRGSWSPPGRPTSRSTRSGSSATGPPAAWAWPSPRPRRAGGVRRPCSWGRSGGRRRWPVRPSASSGSAPRPTWRPPSPPSGPTTTCS